MADRQHRVTIPQHLKDRAKKRAEELDLSLTQYVTELITIDVSAITKESLGPTRTPSLNKSQPTINVSLGNGWGDEI